MPQKIYYAIYKKSNKQVLQTRLEISDNANLLSLDFWLAEFCEDRNFNAVEYASTILSAPVPKEGGHDMYIYDEATNALVIDPNWIAPPAVETSSIPVSGT
jgi:hypothetical protein